MKKTSSDVFFLLTLCDDNKNGHATYTMYMTYYNFHAKAKRLIANGHCISASLFSNYRQIRPALVLYFENNIPIPIRDYMWKDYIPLLEQNHIKINNPEGVDLDKFTSID